MYIYIYILIYIYIYNTYIYIYIYYVYIYICIYIARPSTWLSRPKAAPRGPLPTDDFPTSHVRQLICFTVYWMIVFAVIIVVFVYFVLITRSEAG